MSDTTEPQEEPMPLPELPEPDEPEEAGAYEETLLTEEQRARIEALWQARLLLVHEAESSHPFGHQIVATALGREKTYPIDLQMLATFILDGGEIDEEHGCSGRRCACELAAEFTGGEEDVPAVPEIHDGTLLDDAYRPGTTDLVAESRREFQAKEESL